MSKYDTERRGLDAMALQDNALLKEALATIEAQALEAALSAWTDKKRQRHLQKIDVTREIRQHLEGVILIAKQAARLPPRTA